ncbi:MAG TPA: ATP-binding protein, partial [Woeseiaceae bacterium]|nr:ATP-binding protein [Woeseiaceae bacterium]
LDVSRAMRGKIELRREPVELATVVARAVETAQPLIEAQNHELEIALPEESLLLHADPVRLSQVFGNLLTNAAKYSEPGARILLSARRKDDKAHIRVVDNGIGIAADLLPHIFDLFVQVDHNTARKHSGLGIGLTLVKNLVKLHGGTVEARSPGLGGGSEFLVQLPLMPGRQQPLDKSDQQAPPDAVTSGHRLLIVDDNVDAASTLATLLRLQGHNVRIAYGSTALEVAEKFAPALILLDLGMPDMDGYEVARRIRQIPPLDGSRLVALTGWGQEEDRRRTAEAGFDRHLVKPIQPEVLESLLADLEPNIQSGDRDS